MEMSSCLADCVSLCLVQEQTEEQLEKEKAQCEELRECQSALEKDKNKLSADLKALAEKNEKVSLLTYNPTLYTHLQSNLFEGALFFHCKKVTIIINC